MSKDGGAGHACKHYDGIKTTEQYQTARVKCAREESGKPFISDQVISYSEFKNGYENKCYFGGYDRTVILDRLNKGVGLVQPVYLYGEDGVVVVDWTSTEKLIRTIKNSLKLNVKPLNDTKAYDKILGEYRAKKRTGSAFELLTSVGTDPVGNLHYTEVISKLSPVDYLVAPSQDIVDAILSGDVSRMQEYFKLAGSSKNADTSNKKTFNPTEIQQIRGINAQLDVMIRSNAQNVKLNFQLTERMKSYNPNDQSFLFGTGLLRGCEVADISNQFIEKQAAQVAAAGATNKTFAQNLTDLIQIDTTNGFELSISNEKGLRDEYISELKKLRESKNSYLESMTLRYKKVNDQLVPFAATAFQKFKVTGFTESKKL